MLELIQLVKDSGLSLPLPGRRMIDSLVYILGESLALSRRSKTRTKKVGIVLAALIAASASAAVFGGLLNPPAPPPVSDRVREYAANPPKVEEPKIVIAIGDSFTGGSPAGGSRGTPQNWVAVAAAQLRSEGFNLAPYERGIGGSGYVHVGPEKKVFGDRVPEMLNEKTDVVVFFGSINDMSEPIDVVKATADKVFTDARAKAPNAKFIIVGPAWMNPNVPDAVFNIRDVLAGLAVKHGADWVDPVADKWFFDRPDLKGKDSTHPTDEGHAYMAERIIPHIRAALKS